MFEERAEFAEQRQLGRHGAHFHILRVGANSALPPGDLDVIRPPIIQPCDSILAVQPELAPLYRAAG